MNINQTYLPQIFCLISQSSITTVTIIRIYDNLQQFPVRQFGPASTIICSLCFLFTNILNLIGKIIVNNNITKYTSQCKLFDSNILMVLAILYNMIRQLPFVLFAIKTLRVSLCFWPRFNKINVQDINHIFVQILKNQTYFVTLGIFYVGIINLLNIGIWGVGQHYSYVFYQYFCPKTFSIIQAIVSGLRFIALSFVLYLSLWTYVELDFKKFLFLVFLISNISIIPHLVITLSIHLYQKDVLNHDSIYYTTYIIQLLNTCIIFYYSGINKQLNQPAMQGVLQSWQAFHNLKIGMNILFNYAQYLDQIKKSNIDYHYRCLQSYDYLDSLLKQAYTNKNFQLKYQLAVVQKIVQRNKFVRRKLTETTADQYRKKCADGTLGIQGVKRIQKILSNFCESDIFGGWKKTNSYKALKQQFINNGDINQKLGLFGIPVL